MTDPGRHEPERHRERLDELDGQLPLIPCWPCCCHGGFSGQHACCVHPAGSSGTADTPS